MYPFSTNAFLRINFRLFTHIALIPDYGSTCTTNKHYTAKCMQ